MPFLHIANTCFEDELVHGGSFTTLFEKNPLFLQLQFLPLLYGRSNDALAVSYAPDPSLETPCCYLLEENHFPDLQIESWGTSPSIANWAKEKKLTYKMPPWEVVKQVNSKAFSFIEAPKLPGATLVYSWEELVQWIALTEGPKVLKSCFGVSGRGHLFVPSPQMESFAQKEFQAKRPIIAEPWVEKKLDFSTQWMIDSDIEYLGATICITNQRGSYTATIAGDHLFGSYLPLVEKHQEIARPILAKMKSLGYFGHVGIDAMIWGDDHLHPVVEINARKTMGWVAIELTKHRFRKQTIRLSYVTKSDSVNLLPNRVVRKNGSTIHFKRKLTVDILANSG